MQQISASVYAETGFQGCNVGAIATSEGVVLVDSPQFPSDAIRWRTAIQPKGMVRYLINTEHHSDHIAGNFYFDTTVVSHEGTRQAFAASLGTTKQLDEMVRAMDPEGVALLRDYRPRPPSITYSGRMALHVGDLTIELMNLPGHTPNETAVYVPEEKVLFTGDNVVAGSLPYLFQAVPFGWMDSLQTMASLDVEVIVPGHGEVCGRSAIGEVRSLLEEIIEAIRRAMSAGMSKEEAADRVSFRDRFPIDPARAARMAQLWRAGVMRVYDELARQG